MEARSVKSGCHPGGLTSELLIVVCFGLGGRNETLRVIALRALSNRVMLAPVQMALPPAA